MIHVIVPPSRVRKLVARALSCAGALALAACMTAPPPAPTPPPGEPPAPVATFTPVAWREVPGWREDAIGQALPALLQSCRRVGGSPGWAEPCAAAEALDAQDHAAARAFLELHFTPHRIGSSDGSATGLVTGYYEPLLEGSRTANAVFRFPVHAPPDDLLTVDLGELHPELRNKRVRGRIEGRRVIPYFARADIEAGLAPTRGKELAWVADPLELFFLQIQGSGRIRLGDGTTLRVGYADQNGHPYRAIGRVLVERGELTVEDASMQGIREWARRNPDRLPALLDENPSYVFFRELPPNPAGAPDGPLGALGVPLSPGRSVAIDRTQIPLGAPLFLSTTHPGNGAALQRLVLAQDTGGAIRGPLRADFFWGFGTAAGEEAGRMREQGRLWLLWPVGADLPGSPRA